MQPREVKTKYDQGLKPNSQDMLWLLQLVEALAKQVRNAAAQIEGFQCGLCNGEDGHHTDRCPVSLAEAALARNWRILE